MEWLANFLFSDGGYSPHGFCIAWNLPVLYTHITADLLIAASYFAIPAIILVFLRRRRDSRLHAVAMLFVIFITACGLSHLMSIVTMYLPYYGLQGLLKLFTGIVSLVTAVALWKMLPDALLIPAPEELVRALAEKEEEITQKRRAVKRMEASQRDLAHKVEELQAANSELREFAYAASHDLKSPANTLSLWLADFAQEARDRLSPQLNDELAEARRIVERMRQLVEDILDYSRIVSFAPSPPETCDLGKMVQDTLEGLRGEIVAADAKVDVGTLPRLEGYPPMLSVLLHNLVSNALKFRDPSRKPEISVTAEEDAYSVILSVRDNGIGIEPAHHEKIFSLFTRLHHDSEFSGTGLGLALCRRVAVLHGSTIGVFSKEGVGTEFRVTFTKEDTQKEDTLYAEQAA